MNLKIWSRNNSEQKKTKEQEILQQVDEVKIQMQDNINKMVVNLDDVSNLLDTTGTQIILCEKWTKL